MGSGLFGRIAKKAVNLATLPGKAIVKKGMKDATYFARHPSQLPEFAKKVSTEGVKGVYDFGRKHYEGPFAKAFHKVEKHIPSTNKVIKYASTIKK